MDHCKECNRPTLPEENRGTASYPLCPRCGAVDKLSLSADVIDHWAGIPRPVVTVPTHKTDDELAALLATGPTTSRWRHYKGRLYFLHGCSIQEGTLEVQVTYHPWNSSLRFTRPLAEWTELVEHEGQRVPRFVEAD